MAQEVKVSIRGFQGVETIENGDAVTVVSVGQLEICDGYTTITYDEVIDEEENGMVQVAKNTIKLQPNDQGCQIDVIKKGPVESHMVFIPEQTTYSYYATPTGELEIGIHTYTICWSQTEGGFELRIDYELEMNQTFISNCSVLIGVDW